VIHDGPEPWSVCQGTGPACTELYDYSDVRFVPDLGCEGTTARICMNYREHVFNCGTLAKGFTCQASQWEDYCGLASECVSGNSATCEGDDIVLCNAGRLDRIDCKALGFDGCDPDVGLCYPSPGSSQR
jgi:hypothetical protein